MLGHHACPHAMANLTPPRVLLAEILVHYCIANGMDAEFHQWEKDIARTSACICIMFFGEMACLGELARDGL